MRNPTFHVGKLQITKLHELDLNDFHATELLPDLHPDELAKYTERSEDRTFDPQTDKVAMSVHTWVVRWDNKILLIDTGAGNEKSRPTLKTLDHLHNPYLERLRMIGVEPEQVNFVLLTHVHADHIGWNTVRAGDAWVPTFPNATVICSGREWRYGAALSADDQVDAEKIRAEAGFGEPSRKPLPGAFADSMAPLEASGNLRLVAVDGSEVLPGIRFLPTAGHSIDHAAISVTSEGSEAVFGGDVMHHLLELENPELVSMFCEFPDAARHSRRKLVAYVAERDATYFSSHLPHTSAGKIRCSEEVFSWAFLNGV